MGVFGHHGQSGRIAHCAALGAACLALAHCAGSNGTSHVAADQGVAGKTPASKTPASETPANERAAKRVHRAQKPAAVGGRQQILQEGVNYSAVGVASWYGADFHGRRTANGEVYDMHSLTAAHPTLPLPSIVRVTNLANHRSLLVRVNDRGPYVGQRVIDVSAKTAQLLGFYSHGLARVKIDYLGRAPRNVSGDSTRTAID